MDFIQALDTQLLLWFQSFQNPILNPIMILFSYLGQAGIVWIFISLVLMVKKKGRTAGFYVLITMGLCYLFNDMVIKYLIQRPRPFLTIPALTVLTHRPETYAFPSGHACSSFAAAFMLKKLLNRNAYYLLAVLIALSRPYVGVHYVTDILAGALVGTMGAWCVHRLLKRSGRIGPPTSRE